MIHHHIDRAISRLNFHQMCVDDFKDIFESIEEEKLNEMFSEDETEFNTNARRDDSIDEDFFTYCHDELKYHKHELERAKVRLRICMLTFNRGWTF